MSSAAIEGKIGSSTARQTAISSFGLKSCSVVDLANSSHRDTVRNHENSLLPLRFVYASSSIWINFKVSDRRGAK